MNKKGKKEGRGEVGRIGLPWRDLNHPALIPINRMVPDKHTLDPL